MYKPRDIHGALLPSRIINLKFSIYHMTETHHPSHSLLTMMALNAQLEI